MITTANRKLVLLAGEKAVVAYEKRRLEVLGRSDLASLVEHLAVTEGDDLGYDVRSYDE